MQAMGCIALQAMVDGHSNHTSSAIDLGGAEVGACMPGVFLLQGVSASESTHMATA